MHRRVAGDATPAGTVYARDTARNLVFTVSESLLTELEQGVDEYRRKNLFAFRPFNATALEIDRDDERWRFEKVTSPVVSVSVLFFSYKKS